MKSRRMPALNRAQAPDLSDESRKPGLHPLTPLPHLSILVVTPKSGRFMKKLVILLVLALEVAVFGCGNNTNTSTILTQTTNSNWEAQLTGAPGGQASQLNFVVTFSVNNTGPLNITGFGFFNSGSCFVNGLNQQTETGTTTLTTASTGQVTGPFSLTIKSNATGTTLALTGTITGTSSGTTTTTGNLSNGVVVGTWTLTPGANANGCPTIAAPKDNATFLMCQGTATCTQTAAVEQAVEKL